MPWIDLHTHSTASDGTLAPSELFALARELELRAVALTDHDTVSGLAEFLEAGKNHPECEAVSGVELATSWCGKELHIVGLFIDPASQTLLDFMQSARQERERRNRELFFRLRSLGYALTESDPEFGGRPWSELGRPHFASALVRLGAFATRQQAFDKLLGRSRPAYVPRKLPVPAAAIAAIHAAGGCAVWAHPILRDSSEKSMLNRLTRKLVPAGLDALEGYYSTFGPEETARVRETAERYNLAVSGGSDFHGANSPNVILGFGAGGLRVPEELLTELRLRRGGRIVTEPAEEELPAEEEK